MAIHEMTQTTPLYTRYAPTAAVMPDRLAAASGAIGFGLTIGAIVVGATTGTLAANPGAPAAESPGHMPTRQHRWCGSARCCRCLAC